MAPERAAVVGVRSIGTALSAIVAAVLNANGWQAHRFTLRPGGHPYTREVTIDPNDLAEAS
jgi:hypothetical protein